MINLKGAIGYTLLGKKKFAPNKILIFSDHHDQLEYCKDSEDISEFLKKKQLTNNILLEEVKRVDSIKLKELWSDSEHTQLLKKYYLEDSKNCKDDMCIKPVDIRPFLITASLEYVDDKITLRQYMNNVNDFYEFKSNIFKQELGNIYTYYFFSKKQRLLFHFNLIKESYLNFLDMNKSILDTPIKLYSNDVKLYNNIIIILSDIMEFYIILKIYEYRKNNSIIHMGKYHYDQVIFWLQNLYDYDIIKKHDDKLSGCIEINENIM
jgi:hypothetical protein